jgi:hypothetical protein
MSGLSQPCPTERGLVAYPLPSGRSYQLSSPRLPWVPHYRVLHVREGDEPLCEDDLEEFVGLATRLGRESAQATLGDPQCFSLLFNAGRTRRRALLFLSLKRLLRWRRWPAVRWLKARSRGCAQAHFQSVGSS